jgi:hypothetical protein
VITLASVALPIRKKYFEQSSADCWNVLDIHIIPHVLGSIEVILFMFD